MKRVLGFLLLGLTVQAASAALPTMRQDKLCLVHAVDEMKSCEEGSLMFFQPRLWGNEQLPLVAITAACDFRFSVAYNKAGVVCVFTKRRLHYLTD